MAFSVSLNKKRQNQNPSLSSHPPPRPQSPAIYLPVELNCGKKKKERKDIFKRTFLFLPLFLCSLVLLTSPVSVPLSTILSICSGLSTLQAVSSSIIERSLHSSLFKVDRRNLVTTSLYLAPSSFFVIPRLSFSVDCETVLTISESAQTVFGTT
jgi:hypothetical protein